MLKPREIQYLRSQWQKHLDSPPFQYCDRFCEECRFTFCCSLYYGEKKQRLEILKQGKDPDDPKMAMKQVKESFSQTMKMLKKMAKRDGFNLDLAHLGKDVPKDAFDSFLPRKISICREAEQWVEISFGILNELAKPTNKNAVPFYIYPQLDKFGHYASVVPSKLYRAMLYFYDKTEKDNEGFYDDAARSAALALCSLAFCSNVIRSVAKMQMKKIGWRCAEAVSLANKLEHQIKKRFPDVESYRSKIIFNSI